jgi:hypothetical protein
LQSQRSEEPKKLAWYDDEAQQDEAREAVRLRRHVADQSSSLRVIFRQQVDGDIAGINNHPRWSSKLNGFPLATENHVFGGGFDVVKHGHPLVFVGISYTETHILIARKFIENPVEDKYLDEEELEIKAKANQIVLRTASRKFLSIPEASRYVLQPFIDTLIAS